MGSIITSGSSCGPLPNADAEPPDCAANASGPSVASARIASRRMQHDRRLVYDRRRLIRFDPDRRASAERRFGVEAWAIP